MTDSHEQSPIDELRNRVERLEAELERRMNESFPAAGQTVVPVPERKLLSRAGMLKAAAAGAAALGAGSLIAQQTGTALAASGTFDSSVAGTPAVTASGTNGAEGINATSDSTTGVHGSSSGVSGYTPPKPTWNPTGAIGVWGDSHTGLGVYGTSYTWVGVYGQAVANTGVWGYSQNADGILGMSNNAYGGHFWGGKAPLWLTPSTVPGPPPRLNFGTYNTGTLYVDSAGKLYIATATSADGNFLPLSTFQSFSGPHRVFGDGTVTAAGTTTPAIDATLGTGVPAGATSAFCAVQATAQGVMTLFPDGAPDPGIANWANTGAPGQLALFYMLVPLSAAGKFRIHTYLTGQIYVDVWGYLV